MNEIGTENHYLHNRMERIELKMDRLVEAVTMLARHDERLGGMEARMKVLESQLSSDERRLITIERTQSETGIYTTGLGWLIRQLMVVAIAALVGGLYALDKLPF